MSKTPKPRRRTTTKKPAKAAPRAKKAAAAEVASEIAINDIESAPVGGVESPIDAMPGGGMDAPAVEFDRPRETPEAAPFAESESSADDESPSPSFVGDAPFASSRESEFEAPPESPRAFDAAPPIDDSPANDRADARSAAEVRTHILAERAEKAHKEIFDQSVIFGQLGLRRTIQRSIDEMGWKHPTSIQAKLIPVALTGRDVLGQAKTGTGKTAAFGLPLIHLCSREVPFQALILAPTRELAVQITVEINELAKHTPIRALSVYGGQAIAQQARGLQRGAEIIVGTPGRVMDMVQRGLLHFRNLRFAVLDEVDRMLDIGFREDIRRILEMCPRPGVPVPPEHPSFPAGRQTIFVSATISADIEKLARRYMLDPEKIVSMSKSLTVSLVEQHHLTVKPWDKRRLLHHLLTHEEPALTIVFCRLKRTVDELARYLHEKGIDAHAIHGDMSQGKRNSVMQQLRSGRLEVLIASDLASRGIDVDDISHVINYDLPEDPDLYVHRIGRTARAGKHGVAWSLVTPEQGELLTNIEMLINAEIPRMDYPDFKEGDKPPHWRDDPGGRREGGLVRADLPAVKPPEKVEEPERGTVEALPQDPAKADPSKFPGGIVPTKLPPKRLFGRTMGRR